jgi:uncharacterized protein YeaO (DUF488 family)
MSLHIYRYGEAAGKEGLFVGVTHYLPRGVRRETYAADGYFDVWIPLLSPSRDLLRAFQSGKISFAQFGRRYRSEMREPAPRQAIRLLAATSRVQPVHLGCYCADPARCHRVLLQDLVVSAVKDLPPAREKSRSFASPACSMPEIED